MPPVSILPTCTNLTATPTSGATPLTVSFSGAGANLGSGALYHILVRDNSGATIANLNGPNVSYVFNTGGIFTAQLFIDTNTGGVAYTGLTAPACTTGNLTVSPACIPGTTTGAQTSVVTATTAGLCLGGPASVG